jgi:hypothetical protein
MKARILQSEAARRQQILVMRPDFLKKILLTPVRPPRRKSRDVTASTI